MQQGEQGAFAVSTKFPDIFQALAAPFDPAEVKTRPGDRGRKLSYITARTAMNRLDEVLGPENWWDAYCLSPVSNNQGVLCQLTIRLPDGQTVTKEGIGGVTTMHDPSDTDKTAECLPLDAQALTPNGWATYDSLHVGDRIMGLDMDSGSLAWTTVEAVNVHRGPRTAVEIDSKSFHMVCTPNHRWVTQRRGCDGLRLSPTEDLDSRDMIVIARPMLNSGGMLSPREAAILGWLATDGGFGYFEQGHGRNGTYFKASICQTKEPYRTELRNLLGDDATEGVKLAGTRTFPGHATASPIKEQSVFRIKAPFARQLLRKAGVESWTDLTRTVLTMSYESRRAMLQAMLDADGHHALHGQVTFGKAAKPGVMEAFEILATLQGLALGTSRRSSCGSIPLRTVRKRSHTWAKCLDISDHEPIPVWCPTTSLGTWVTQWQGTITITSNSDAIKRAAVKFGVGRYLYQDGTSSFDGEPAGSPPTSSARPAPIQREGSYQSWLTSVMSSLGMSQTQIWELHNFIINLLKDSNYEFGCDTNDRKAVFRVVAQMYEGGQAGDWLTDAVERFKAHKK